MKNNFHKTQKVIKASVRSSKNLIHAQMKQNDELFNAHLSFAKMAISFWKHILSIRINSDIISLFGNMSYIHFMYIWFSCVVAFETV